MRLRDAISIALLLPATAGADGLSTRLDLASDSFFRGWRENNGPSASARADYPLGGGPYLGAALANDRAVSDARIDLIAGVSRSLEFAGYLPYRLDGGMVGAVFTGGGGPFHGNPDYAEAYGSLAFGPVSGSLAIAPDYFGTGAASYRLGAALRLPLPAALSFRLQGGWNGGEGVNRYVAARSAGRHARAYLDYAATLNWSLPYGVSIYAQATGSNLSGDQGPYGLIGLRKAFDF